MSEETHHHCDDEDHACPVPGCTFDSPTPPVEPLTGFVDDDSMVACQVLHPNRALSSCRMCILTTENDALLSQLREQRELFDALDRYNDSGQVHALLAAERTVREQREAALSLERERNICQVALERVIDEAYKPGFLDIARDALAALAPNTEGEGT